MTTKHNYGVYISQFIIYSKMCAQYSDFLDRVHLLQQSYVASRLNSSLQTFYDRYHDLVDRYEISISQMTMDHYLFTQISFFPLSPTMFSSDLALYTTSIAGVFQEAEIAYSSRAHGFTLGFWWGPCCSSFFFCVVFRVSCVANVSGMSILDCPIDFL